MAIVRFSLSLGWPVKSSRRVGVVPPRTDVRRPAAPATPCPWLACDYSLPHQFESAPEERLEIGGGRRFLALRTAASAAGRAQPRFNSADSTSCFESVEPGSERRQELRLRLPTRGHLVLQFQNHAFGGLLADAGNANQLFDVARCGWRRSSRPWRRPESTVTARVSARCR